MYASISDNRGVDNWWLYLKIEKIVISAGQHSRLCHQMKASALSLSPAKRCLIKIAENTPITFKLIDGYC